jgi:hypothetical protein
MRNLCRDVAAVVVLVLVGTFVAACGHDDPVAKTVPDRPAMETMIDDRTQMRTEMLAAVDAIAGPGEWAISSSIKEILTSACRAGEDTGGSRAGLPSYSRQGSLTGADREAIEQAVWKVGRAHGFDKTGTIVDRPDDWEIFGDDAYGGRYVFGSAVNTVVSIGIGCHRYDVQPPPAPAPSGVPDHAKKDQG